MIRELDGTEQKTWLDPAHSIFVPSNLCEISNMRFEPHTVGCILPLCSAGFDAFSLRSFGRIHAITLSMLGENLDLVITAEAVSIKYDFD